MLSYWEKKWFTHYDNIVVGAGLAGLFTAMHLQRRFPSERILVIDKNSFPAASTKNAGFACMGSITELEDDLKTTSIEQVVSLFEKRYRGLQMMREELGDVNIDYRANGSFELIEKEDLCVLDNIDFWNEKLFHIAKRNAFSKADISATAFNGFAALIKNELEGEIDTGKMYRSLKMKAAVLGVEFLTAEVINFQKRTHAYELVLEEYGTLQARRLLFCTNAFTKKILPQQHIVPARGQVLITKPIPNLQIQGIYHFDRGYYYFREIDGRILFGGGRHIDVEGEATDQQGQNQRIYEDLKTKLSENILPQTPFEVDYSWSGIMAFAETKEPIAQQIDEDLFVLASFGGMGVALAPYMAWKLVEGL